MLPLSPHNQMPITPCQFEALEAALQRVLAENKPSPNAKPRANGRDLQVEVKSALNQLLYEDSYEVDVGALADALCEASH